MDSVADHVGGALLAFGASGHVELTPVRCVSILQDFETKLSIIAG
jgi:hypothetical protein